MTGPGQRCCSLVTFLNDTSDLYFTGLQAGAFAAEKPNGEPCVTLRSLVATPVSKGAKIALGVVLCIVGSVVIAMAAYIYRRRRNKL